MRKAVPVILCFLLLTGILAGCGTTNTEKSDKLKVVTTILPEYDWVMNVLGENADSASVTMLLDNGSDLHSYQPTVEDMVRISTCDVFIYVGGESAKWVEDALGEATNKNMKVINLMEVLRDSVKEEEVGDGMQKEPKESEEKAEYDEHVWLSLKNAKVVVSAIANVLSEEDSQNSEVYKANAEAYIKKLSALDEKYASAVNTAKTKTILFGDRFPFKYMTDDYNLSYYAAFAGCSSETEASFETISFLAKKVDELNLPAVITIEGTTHNIAKAIIRNTSSKNQQILTLDSMQSITMDDIKNGVTYLLIMEKNLETLKKALN